MLLDVLVDVEWLVLVDVVVGASDVLLVVGGALVVVVDVVVVLPPHGPVGGAVLAGFAGSVPQSSSRRS